VHIPTHILSGWCAANCLPLTPRQRLCAMAAATIADLDGLGFFISREAYWNYHHKLGHNLSFAILSSFLLMFFSASKTISRLELFLFYFLLFHLHLILDYFGSGPGWHIHYFWPFATLLIKSPHPWEFFSWQNILAFLVLLGWTVLIARSKKRTPFELIAPSVEARFFPITNNKEPITNSNVP